MGAVVLVVVVVEGARLLLPHRSAIEPPAELPADQLPHRLAGGSAAAVCWVVVLSVPEETLHCLVLAGGELLPPDSEGLVFGACGLMAGLEIPDR